MRRTVEQHGSEGEYSLKQFQEEMADFVAKEISGEEGSGHFLISGTSTREPKPEFDPVCLTEEDRDVWAKIKNETITLDEFHRYADELGALDNADPAKPSRVIFSEFAGNKVVRAIFNNSKHGI